MFSSLDITVLNWLNHNFIPYSKPFLKFISFTTTYVSISIVTAIFISSVVKNSKILRRFFFILTAILITSGILTLTLKSIFYQERPFITYAFVEKQSTGGGSSFPSGHTMEAFAMAMGFMTLFPKKKRIIIPLFLWAMVVGYSRVALGVHYPSDVIAGMLIGSFIGWIIPWVFTNR